MAGACPTTSQPPITSKMQSALKGPRRARSRGLCPPSSGSPAPTMRSTRAICSLSAGSTIAPSAFCSIPRSCLPLTVDTRSRCARSTRLETSMRHRPFDRGRSTRRRRVVRGPVGPRVVKKRLVAYRLSATDAVDARRHLRFRCSLDRKAVKCRSELVLRLSAYVNALPRRGHRQGAEHE